MGTNVAGGGGFEPDRMEGHWYVAQVDKWSAMKDQECITYSIVDN
jgi:hypothetical protein